MSSLASIVVALVLAAPEAVAERRVPQFDTEKVQATYVVSIPPGYDKSKKWPLILDFHGAISPTRKGANITRARLWALFVKKEPYIVVGLNGRTRAWNMTKGEKNDTAYALHVLAQVRKAYSIDEKRTYLAGFSSGADFLCKGGLQKKGPFTGSLVVCPGPPSVVGLRGGELLTAKGRPFFFLTGEQDYIRKDGAWQAFVALDKAGAATAYREVAGVGHAFPPIDEYVRAMRTLEAMARSKEKAEALAAAVAADIKREDFLSASSRVMQSKLKRRHPLWAQIEARGKVLTKAATAIDAEKEPGRAYEAWWRITTQFHRYPVLAARAGKELLALQDKVSRRELYKARREWFRSQAPANPIAPPSTGNPQSRRGVPWGVNRYLNYTEITTYLKKLAADHSKRARLVAIGKSYQQRTIWAIELTDASTGPARDKPAVYLQGGIHGNEISSSMNLLYMAWQLAANPRRSRSTGKLMRTTAFYLVPAVNPDAVQDFVSKPNSYWRPRYNYRPFDDDGDGKTDEDPYEDLNGDGEIGLMYAPDPKGAYVLKNGRLVRGTGEMTYRLVGREGTDNDGDGKYSEDRPGGVDLNRNFPVGFQSRRRLGGTSGEKAGSEPETRAVMGYVRNRPNIALFLDYHNAANCVFFWNGAGAKKRLRNNADLEWMLKAAAQAEASLGYKVRQLNHAGAGLAIAWAYGARGIPAFIIELESSRGEQQAYYKTAWKDKAFIVAKPFKHPTLGMILIGNDIRKIPRRNLHPTDLVWQAERNWTWVKDRAHDLPRLEFRNAKIARSKGGFEIVGEIANAGKWPTDTQMAHGLNLASPIRIRVEGGQVAGKASFGSLNAGGSHSFRVAIDKPAKSVTLIVSHPHAGTIRLPVLRPLSRTRPIRNDYEIEAQYATPDRAIRANNAYYTRGTTKQERGPAFKVPHRKEELRLAVLLGEWKDQRHSVSAKAFEQALFSVRSYTDRSATGQQVYGSLRDFYDEMSYGKLKVTGKVFDWATLPGKYKDYRNASFGSRILEKQLLLATWAKYGAGALGEFDAIAFVWAGSTVRRTSALWPMRVRLKELPRVVAFKMGEFHQGEMAAIGVACHEMGHTFGVNDKYGLGATAEPLGQWCLMAKGTHGSGPSGRHRPFHMCAWCKSVIGWVKPAVVDPTVRQKLALRPIQTGPGEGFRILLKPDGSEYLLLENRRREGFHTDLPAPGLVVLRVGPNDRPASPQTRVRLIPAHGKPPSGRGILARPAEVAWPQANRTELIVDSVKLSNIRIKDDVVYFEVGPVR